MPPINLKYEALEVSVRLLKKLRRRRAWREDTWRVILEELDLRIPKLRKAEIDGLYQYHAVLSLAHTYLESDSDEEKRKELSRKTLEATLAMQNMMYQLAFSDDEQREINDYILKCRELVR